MTAPPPRNPSNLQAAEWIVRSLRDAGHQALFAGGCVRDLLMDRAPTDYDVATDARPERVLALFPRTRAVGRQFGVALVGVGRHWIEVATFRTDASYSDGRRPDGVQFCTAEQDAARRDFTINGMFYDPIAGDVLDYVSGREDLKRRLVRAIGDPRARFAEDHLRLLRAIRFAARLDFAIEPATWKALRGLAHLLPRVSAERRHDELEQMLTPPSRVAAWSELCRSGLVAHLWHGSERLLERASAIAALLGVWTEPITFELALAALCLPSPDEARWVCRELRASNPRRDAAAWLVRHHADLDRPDELSTADLKRLMAGPAFADLRALFEARCRVDAEPESIRRTVEQRIAAIPPHEVAPPPLVTGHDLIALGAPTGPIYGRVLSAVYRDQLNGDVTNKPAAIEAARRLLTDSQSG